MTRRGNTADYADAFVELFKIASMLDIWEKPRESEILTAIMHDNHDKLKELSVKKAEMLSLHSEIKSALKDASCPDGVIYAVEEIFKTPLSNAGVKVGHRKLAAKKSTTKEYDTTVDLLKARLETPEEYTRPTATSKIKAKPPLPFRRNLEDGDQYPPSETSTEYFAKLNLSSMPAEEAQKNGYEGLNELYSRRPNDGVNKKRFKQTQQAHKPEGVLIVPAYMNNGIMFRGDLVHMILENIARRDTTGLSVYVGAVPLGKEDLRNVGDLAMRLTMKDHDMVAQKLSGMVFTALFNKVANSGAEVVESLKKTAYNNNAFESQGSVPREVIYPIRPESNIQQYAHNEKVISIDGRSLSGVIMRADVKNKVLLRMSLQRPLGKTSTDLKVYYVKMIEAGEIHKAVKFKKAVRELYDVDCGELDDKVLDAAHEKSVNLEGLESALFPTRCDQQRIDTEKATSKPTGRVNDNPVKFSFIDMKTLLDKYVTAKRKAAKRDDDNDDNVEEAKELLEATKSDGEKDDPECDETCGIIPGGIEVLEVGGPESKENMKNISVNIHTDPNSGEVIVSLNGSMEKKFESVEEATKWAGKVSEIFNNVLDSSSNVAAAFKFSDFLKLATMYNGLVSHFVKLATTSHNINEMLEFYNELD